RSDANAFTQPMLDCVGRKVGHRIECDVYPGATRDDLREFGKKLRAGEFHVGVVWGIEYGWLGGDSSDLKILAVVSVVGNETISRTVVLVRKDSGITRLADLKGKRLAGYKDFPLMDRVFLNKMLRDEKLDPKDFFGKGETFGSLKAAAFAVKDGKAADCVVMSNVSFARLKRVTRLDEALVELKAGEVYPLPVLIGSPDAVNRLGKKKGLWDELQKQFLAAHRTPEGAECMNFWRVQSFVAADADFRRRVRAATDKVPADALLNLD
ncbi:MAG TPA: PhnD/SsuA/transferrin family substrate-binding protein, partial [Gemmataceae bacterium]|nr:PhnD/SsuA/transferrin family substrate-binding protein [Gemmataceae bacterium]